MKKIDFKKAFPYLFSIIFFLALVLVYFAPIFGGKVMQQHDIQTFKGMSKEISDYKEKDKEPILWTNSMFGGMPSYQILSPDNGNLISSYCSKIITLNLPTPTHIVFLYLLGFFILMMAMGINIWLSIAGSIAFAFSTYFFLILDAGHLTKAYAIAYMAPTLAGIILLYRGKYLLGAALAGFFISLEIACNHLQITYYFLYIIGFYLLSELFFAIREKRLLPFAKASGLLLVAAILAVGTNFTNLWTTYEYSAETIRGKTELTSEQSNRTSGLDKDYATAWSYGKAETFNLLVPNLMGGASNSELPQSSETYQFLTANTSQAEANRLIKQMPTYWGDQPGTSGPVYIGAIVIFLFVLALFVADKRYKWWLLGATILSILLSWGHNFAGLTNFFLDYVPGYNKFRAVSMILVIAEFAIPLLAILGLQKVFFSKENQALTDKKLYTAAGITGGICLIFLLIGKSLFSFVSPQDAGFPKWLQETIVPDRMSMLIADSWRSLLLIVLAAAGIWLYLKGYAKKTYVLPALALLILIDLWAVDRRYLNNDDFVNKRVVNASFAPTPADEAILQDTDPNFRVLNTTVSTFNDASTSYYHKSIGGYHGAKLRRYQELIEHQIAKNNPSVLDMLNTKYFIYPDQNRQPQVAPNPNAAGNVWFVDHYKIVNNADEELKALDSLKVKQEAIIDKRFESDVTGHTISKDSTASIALVNYHPNHLKYESNASKEQLAVFSEIYYDKGWNAYIDGKSAPYFRANYVLRAMVVPAGKHEIEFRFEPRSFFVGEKISYTCSILLIVMILASIGLAIFQKPKPATEATVGK